MIDAVDNRPSSERLLRATLLASVAAGALMLVAPRAARAQTVPPAAPCNTGFDLSSHFKDGPAAVNGFTTRNELDDVLANVSAGLDVLMNSGTTLRLSYDGAFGDTTQSHAGGIRGEVRF